MPYSTSVTFLDTEGGSSLTTSVTARLWMLWTEVGGPTAVHRKQEEDSSTFDLNKGLTIPSAISFSRDGTFSDLGRQFFAGLSIQDANRVNNDTGWLFRSNSFENLPTDSIELVGATVSLPASDLPSLLPTPPITVDSTTTITGLTASLGVGTNGPPPMPSGIDFTATGTTTRTGVVVGFRFTGRIVFTPSDDIANASTEAFSVGINNPRIVFISGPSVLSAVEAEILNLLRVFILHDNLPTIRAKLESRINMSIISQAGRSLPGSMLPEGVILSVRSVFIRSDASALDVRACLGAFGGVFSKLPPVGSSRPRICPLTTLIGLGYQMTGLLLMRDIRDTRLAATRAGSRLIELYYRFGPEVSAVLVRDYLLADRVAQAIRDVTDLIKCGAPIPAPLRRQCELLLREIASQGSEELHSAVSEILEANVWRLVTAN